MSCWSFRLVLAGLAATLLLCIAPQSSSALTCRIMSLSNGLFQYQLSEPTSSPSCETCWVDDNDIVIARDSQFDVNLTVGLTNQSITLKNCSDHLYYTRECNGHHEDAHCRVNCSALLDPEPLTTTVNSTLICIIESWCPEPKTVILILGIFGIFFLFVGVFVVVLIKCRRRRRGPQSVVSYTPATQQIKTEIL